MLDLFKAELNDKEYDSVESYNADVLGVSRGLEEDLGRAERLMLDLNPEILEEMEIKIKGVN